MALKDVFRTIGSGLSQEIREARSIIRNVRLGADSSPLGANFRRFGSSFDVYDFSDFADKAKEFYRQGIDSENPDYTVVELPGNRVAIDYNGEIRGIYTRKGKPIAFFRHDFRQAGYASKSAELEDFKKGRHILFS